MRDISKRKDPGCIKCSLCFLFVCVVLFNSSAIVTHGFQNANIISSDVAVSQYRKMRSKSLSPPIRESFQRCSFVTSKRDKKHLTSIDGVNNSNDPYSRELRLREEADSPFRKVRFLVYGALSAGAATSLVVSLTRIAAGIAGVNVDLLNESLENVIIDSAGIILLYFLWKRDSDEQESRLKQAARGGDYAKLMVRGSRLLLSNDTNNKSAVVAESTVSRSLSSLKRGQDIVKRVVIAAAGKDTIRNMLEEMADKSMDLSLNKNDFVIVPVTLPQCTAPLGIEKSIIDKISSFTAFPAGGDWADTISTESETAKNQGIDVLNEGFCIVLEGGRVGQRTKGVKLERMITA